MFFGYLGLSEPCCSLQCFLQTKLCRPWKRNWDTGTMHWAGIQNVGGASLLPFTCFLGKRVLASRVICPKQMRVLSHPFLDTPEQGGRGTSSLILFISDAKIHCGLPRLATSPQMLVTFPYNLNAEHHHPTVHSVKTQGKGRPATSGCTISVSGSGLLKELLERVPQRLQR